MVDRVPNDALEMHSGDPVEAALEAGCESLLELQLIYATTPHDLTIREHATQAIRSLQNALAQLRLVHEHDESVLAYGFVVPATQRRSTNRVRSV